MCKSRLTLSLLASPNGDRKYDGVAIAGDVFFDVLSRVSCSPQESTMRFGDFRALPPGRIHNLLRIPTTADIKTRTSHSHFTMAAVNDRAQGSEDVPGVYERAQHSVKFIRSRIAQELQSPRVAIVCGSGLGGIADLVSSEARSEIHYADIPDFPKTTGKMILLTSVKWI